MEDARHARIARLLDAEEIHDIGAEDVHVAERLIVITASNYTDQYRWDGGKRHHDTWSYATWDEVDHALAHMSMGDGLIGVFDQETGRFYDDFTETRMVALDRTTSRAIA